MVVDEETGFYCDSEGSSGDDIGVPPSNNKNRNKSSGSSSRGKGGDQIGGLKESGRI
jgi:hypothetical protein